MARQTITTIRQQQGNLLKASGRGPTYRVMHQYVFGMRTLWPLRLILSDEN